MDELAESLNSGPVGQRLREHEDFGAKDLATLRRYDEWKAT